MSTLFDGLDFGEFDPAKVDAAGVPTWAQAAAAGRGPDGGPDALERGPVRTDPEELLVAAASACQLLSFLAVAARARIDVVHYRDDATGIMPDDNQPRWVTRIDLRPAITVRDPEGRVTPERIHHLSEVGHRECFIAASLRSEIVVSPTVSILPS